ncbi:MAG: phosphatidic acid phosphatase [Brachybacterium faecium]|nr:MAG: phosphatidic acid phosphatase [Brachybacterium faecium]
MRRRRSGVPVRPVLSGLLALLCAAMVVLLARIAVGTASGQRLDQLTLSGAQLDTGPVSQVVGLAAGTVSLPVVLAALACVAVIAVLRRRADLLVPLAVLVGGANLSTQAIKHLVITREVLGPGIDVTPNSFPSGHTTLAASTAIALVLVAGRARGPVAVLGALWTAGAGIGTLALGWHRASDVAGAIVVVATWTFLMLAVDGVLQYRRAPSAEEREPRRGIEVATAWALGLAGAAGMVLGVVAFAALGLPLLLHEPGHQQAAYRTTVAVISGGTALWMAMVLMLRVPEPRRASRGDRVP